MGAWNLVTSAIEQRLEEAQAQHARSVSTDADDYAPSGSLERALQ